MRFGGPRRLFNETCDVYLASVSLSGGGEVIDYKPHVMGVKCRASNPTGSEGIEVGGLRSAQSRRLYVGGDEDIQASHYVKYAGKAWAIEAVQRFGSELSPEYQRLDLRRVEGVHLA